jgi:hypothetical protein
VDSVYSPVADSSDKKSRLRRYFESVQQVRWYFDVIDSPVRISVVYPTKLLSAGGTLMKSILQSEFLLYIQQNYLEQKPLDSRGLMIMLVICGLQCALKYQSDTARGIVSYFDKVGLRCVFSIHSRRLLSTKGPVFRFISF